MCFARYVHTIAIPMALCTGDLPIRAENLQDLNGNEKHGCGAAHILLKLRWEKKNLSLSKYPTFEISRGGVSALISWQNITASCLQPNALATSGSESFVT